MLALKPHVLALALLLAPLPLHAEADATDPKPIRLTVSVGMIDDSYIVVPALVDARGYPVFGPDGQLVPTPIAFGKDGAPLVGPYGDPILLTGANHPRATLTDASGRPLKDAAGRPLTAPALIDREGRPVARADGSLVPLAVVRTKAGRPVLSASGETMLAAPDIPEALPLVRDGKVVLGPWDTPLMVPIQKDTDGRPILDADGKPQRVVIKTNEQGQPLLGADGRVIVAQPGDDPALEVVRVADCGEINIGREGLVMTMALIAIIAVFYLLAHLVRQRAEG